MSRFTALVGHLAATAGELAEVRLSFAEIEEVIRHPLPASASQHWYWHGRGHRHHVALLDDAGWSCHLDPRAKTVAFRRTTEEAAARVERPSGPRGVEGEAEVVAARAERVLDLTRNFRHYVQRFTERQGEPQQALFTGPSAYFHKRSLQRRECVGLEGVLADRETEFFELVYATLVSWGMHRMGAGGTKLVQFGDFRRSILRDAGAILELRDIRLCDLDQRSAAEVAKHLVGLMGALHVSRSRTRMVACSKTLHHLLPRLVPPMDREYTLWFFHAPTDKSSGIDRLFPDVYCRCASIAAANRAVLPDLVSGYDGLKSEVVDTSEAKLIDNAIVEYVVSTRGRRPRGGRRNRGA